ncbi:MAG TPA: N-acetylmuramoyl-L-alanine amidase [Propionibacteriaceae bacterium]|nr:N-acetylmuramoyl-L-alanine amidase [Propionibacteriaceae bacterium]
MPWLTDLADACRSSGIQVTEYANWKNRGHGSMSGVKTITCHHTAGPKTGDAPSLGTVVNGRPGLPGPLAQLFLSRSGVCTVVAAGLSYHAGQSKDSSMNNDWAIGIEAEATGVDPWPQAQYDAYAKLCAGLRTWYRLDVARVMGHKETCSPSGRKIDPNFDMNSFRVAVGAGGGLTPDLSTNDLIDEDQDMLIFFDTITVDAGRPATPGDPDADPPVLPDPGKPAKYQYNFHGQRTCEAGGGSNIAKSAWACFSTAWGGCSVFLAANDGKGRTWNLLGAPGKPAGVKNNSQIPFPLPEGARIVTIEGVRDSPGTVVACDVYNLR